MISVTLKHLENEDPGSWEAFAEAAEAVILMLQAMTHGGMSTKEAFDTIIKSMSLSTKTAGLQGIGDMAAAFLATAILWGKDTGRITFVD